MDRIKVIYWVSTITLFAGMLLAFLPHALHEQSGVGNVKDHLVHVINGSILIVFGLGMMILNEKLNKKK